MKPFISVIVPIYNVKPWLDKCLKSLKNQTMREIEIVCIDDGSTDGSGNIADEYVSEEFPIFRVIHTDNRGLSAARNRGIDEARADWLMFVDSDDWVDSRFCEIPWKAKNEYGVDLVCFRSYRVRRWGRIKKTKKINSPTGIVDEMTAHEFGGIAVWNKLYKKSLFNEIRFPEGHVFEDLATAHMFVNKAEAIVLLADRLYYHIYRKGSVGYTHTENNKRDEFASASDRYEFLIQCGYPIGKIDWVLNKHALIFLASAQPSQDAMYYKATETVDNIKGIPKEFSIKQKIALMVWKTDKRLFYFISKMSGRMNRA